MSDDPQRVRIEELIELDQVGPGTRPPTPAELRAALPRGWVLEDDHAHARRDLRLWFREGWILMLGLVVFGSVGLSFLWGAVPDGLAGVARLLISLLIVLAVGGIVGPIVTKALNRRA